jgi:hypothetical protein
MCIAVDIARHQWRPSQHIFCSANIQAGQASAAGRVELLKVIGTPFKSVALRDLVGRQFDGLKGAEENEREFSVPCFSLQLPDGSNSTVEENLWLSIPQEAFH